MAKDPKQLDKALKLAKAALKRDFPKGRIKVNKKQARVEITFTNEQAFVGLANHIKNRSWKGKASYRGYRIHFGATGGSGEFYPLSRAYSDPSFSTGEARVTSKNEARRYRTRGTESASKRFNNKPPKEGELFRAKGFTVTFYKGKSK